MQINWSKILGLCIIFMLSFLLFGCNNNNIQEPSSDNTVINVDEISTTDGIKQILLGAQSIMDDLEQDCQSTIVTDKVIKRLYGHDICECNGKFSSFDNIKDAVKNYYISDDIVNYELYKEGLFNVDGKIGVIEDLEGNKYVITNDSEINLLINENNKKVVEAEAWNDTGDTAKIQYILVKQDNGTWVISLEIVEPEYKYIKKDTLSYYDDRLFTASASSSLEEYPIEYIMDGNNNTTWTESVDGEGIGEWVKLNANEDIQVDGIELINGYMKTEKLYNINSRIKRIRIEFSDGTSIEKNLKDHKLYFQNIKFDQPVTTNSIKITILDVDGGYEYEDACIPEIRVYKVSEPGVSVLDPSKDISYLTEEELNTFNDYFDIHGNNEFLFTDYSDPSEINPDLIFYNGADYSDAWNISEAEEEAYLAGTDWEELPIDLVGLTNGQINSFLSKKTGLTLDELERGLSWVYLPEFDKWYDMHSDTNLSKYVCVSGYRTSDGYIIINYDSKGTVILKETNGDYLFISNSNDYGW